MSVEFEAGPEPDQWAREAVQNAAWLHLSGSQECRGFVLVSDGRTSCGRCEWALSARLEAPPAASGQFALFVLAWFGLVVELACTEERR